MRLPLMNFQFRGSSKSGPFVSVMAVAGLIFFCSNSQPAWKKPMIVSEKQSVQKCIHHCSSFHRLANELESNHRNEVPQATIGCSSILSWLVLPSKLPSLWRKERENQQAWVRPLHYHIFSVKTKYYLETTSKNCLVQIMRAKRVIVKTKRFIKAFCSVENRKILPKSEKKFLDAI